MFSAAASISVGLGLLSFLIVVADLAAGHRPKMPIMAVVWPLTALYSGPLGLFVYWFFTRPTKHSLPGSGVLAATHCGSGCTLGDLVAATILIARPFALFGHEMFAEWAVGLGFAFLFGILFQYFTIAPMRHLGLIDGLKAALKADALSLLAWQIGMYAWMAIATFLIFKHPLPKDRPLYWAMMQIAMLMGFATAYPVNVWLIQRGLKERM